MQLRSVLNKGQCLSYVSRLAQPPNRKHRAHIRAAPGGKDGGEQLKNEPDERRWLDAPRAGCRRRAAEDRCVCWGLTGMGGTLLNRWDAGAC